MVPGFQGSRVPEFQVPEFELNLSAKLTISRKLKAEGYKL
jgi:hypothetical protein